MKRDWRNGFKAGGFQAAGIFLAAVLTGGCGSAKVSPAVLPPPAQQPDMVVIQPFAVRMAEVTLDKSLINKTLKEASDADLTEEEVKVGHAVSEKLAQTLVDELNEAGIKAVRAGEGPRATRRTVIIEGQFLNINEGSRTKRVLVGFGLGGSKISTEVEMVQGGHLITSAVTTTKAGLKPGMLVSAGTTVATGGGTAPLMVSGASAGVSEKFFATVEADASRTAKELAKKIKEAYVDRGWL